MLEEMYEHQTRIAWREFEEKLSDKNFTMKISNQAIEVSEMGVPVYTVDKTTVKYNKLAYSDHAYVAPERLAELEEIIFRYCGWGAQGSTRLLEPLKKWKAWHLQNSRYPDLFKEVEG